MNPYISIVVVGRNDNYGGDFLRRISTFVRSLGRQARKYPGLIELVVVEWNPPVERPRLADVLEWPSQLSQRIVSVPKHVHDQVARDSKMPLLEYFGKNAGVRRARGDFILVSNPDIIFSDELIAELARRRLEQQWFYRVDRYDYDGSGIERVRTDNLINFATARVNSVQIRHGSDDAAPISLAIPPGTASGDWPRSAILRKDRVRSQGNRFWKWAYSLVSRSGARGSQNSPEHFADSSPVESSFHAKTQMRFPWVRSRGTIVDCHDNNSQMWGLHTNASGDFLLASRRAWFHCMAFWERLDTFTHLDSYAVCRMRGLGLQQKLFLSPLCIFHMDHPRNEQAGRPSRPWEEVYAELQQLIENPQSLGYAHQTGWGLESFTLPEIELSAEHGTLTEGFE